MRKIISCVLILTVMALASSCALINRDDPKKQERAEADKIFELLKNEDIDALCGLFSEDVRNRYDLESEWKIFFDSIDGNIVSYDSLSFNAEGYGKDKNGEVYDSHMSVNYNKTTTDTGMVYDDIGYFVYRKHPDGKSQEGLSVFTVKLPDSGEWITVGLKD